MSRTRITAEAVAAPKSPEEAQAFLATIGELDRKVAELETQQAARVEEVKAYYGAGVAKLNEDIERLFLGLKAFVETHRDALLPKGRLSVAWPQGTVGFRDTPLSVSVSAKKLEAIVAALRARRLAKSCLRVKTEVDKDALKRHRARVADIDGLAFKSRTEFFARANEAEVEHVKAVAPPKSLKKRSTS